MIAGGLVVWAYTRWHSIPFWPFADAVTHAAILGQGIGRFGCIVNGDVAGFVICTNDNAHENGGFIDLLGIRHDFQGRGFGELLLRWAFAYCVSRGFTDADLAVDTGNSSGALGLYSKVGLTTLSEYHLYAQPVA
jgi:ribosomal protein S18 acetylase RimI-like enzyme